MKATVRPSARAKAPAHLWIIGALGLLWNALACCDYLLTNMRIPAYIVHLQPDLIDFLDAFPGWLVIAWAVEVGCALLGSLLLLGRSRWAAEAFAVALVALAASQAYQLAIGLPPSMTTPLNGGLTLAMWAITVGLLVYAARMRTRGVLR